MLKVTKLRNDRCTKVPQNKNFHHNNKTCLLKDLKDLSIFYVLTYLYVHCTCLFMNVFMFIFESQRFLNYLVFPCTF